MADINSLYTEEQKKQIEDFNNRVDEIQSMLTELYGEISTLRKEGKDCLIVEFDFRNIRSKIPYLRNSQDVKELVKLNMLVDSLKKEIEEVRKEEVIDVKKEIEKKLDEEGIDYIGKMKEE